MEWIELTSEDQVTRIENESKLLSVIIFKYSSRCSTSRLVLNRLERNWEQSEGVVRCYFLDLIRYRNVSDLVAQRFDVPHESPQILVIIDGQCVHEASHYAIDYGKISVAVAGAHARPN